MMLMNVTDEDKQKLWDAITENENHVFKTMKGLEFSYTIKGYEMFVDRKNKSITRSTINIAYEKAIELGGIVTGPKKLGCFGASYIYPIFMHIGVIKNDGAQ